MSGEDQIPGINSNRLDVRIAPDGTKRVVCNLIAFSQFSVPSSNASSANNLSLNPSNYENAFAIDLAIRHLNERNASIIQDIENIDGTCGIEFVGEYIDTEDDAVTAAKRVTNRIDSPETEERFRPCALIGATSSFSESIQTSIVANMKGYAIVSGMNHGTLLSHKKNYPRFARTIPSNFGPASAIVRYAHEELGYRYLVILRANTNHSNDYVSSIRTALGMYDRDDFVVREIWVRQDGSDVEDAISRLKELRMSTVVAIFEGIEYSSNLYDVVMEEAHRQGVAGDGHHVWLFPESLLEYSLYIQKLRTPEEYVESPLQHAYHGAGIIKSGRLESKYYQLVDGITSQSKLPGHLEYMQSVLPNPFGNTSKIATAEMMSEESFLNEKNLDSRIEYLYEATVLLGLSACRASTDDFYLSGDDLYDTLVRYNISGISGNVTLDEVSGSRIQSTTDYSMMNIRAVDGFGIELKHTTTIKSTGLVHVEPFIFNDGTTTKPEAVWSTMVKTELGSTAMLTVTSICCILSVLCPVVCAIWTYQNRKIRIIRASQTFFLYLICLGNFLIALTMAPLITFAFVELNAFHGKVCATLTAWFFFTGFPILASSFYCKLHRINKIINNSRHFKRVTVRVRDSILAVIISLSLNVLFLSFMTAFVAPKLTLRTIDFDRFDRRTIVYQYPDIWSSKWYKAYVIPMVIVNCGTFFLAAFEAWKARNLSTEFQENDSILRALLAVFFGAAICFPVLMLTNDIEVRTFIITAMLTILCISIQGFLFGEKYLYQRKRSASEKLSDEDKESTEKVFSKSGRQALALKNQDLQRQLNELQKATDELRMQLEKSTQQNGTFREVTEKTEQESDVSAFLSLDGSMKPSAPSKPSQIDSNLEMKNHNYDEDEESETFVALSSSMKEVRDARLYSQWHE